jgi:hypothetical protein
MVLCIYCQRQEFIMFNNATCFSLYEHLHTETCSIVEYNKLLSLMVHTNYLWFIISTMVEFHQNKYKFFCKQGFSLFILIHLSHNSVNCVERHNIGNDNNSIVLVQQQTVNKLQIPTTDQRNMNATLLILHTAE